MSRVPIIFNSVSQKVIRIESLPEHNLIPDEYFHEVDINGELTLYVHVTGRKDSKEWLCWNKRAQEWFHFPNPHEQIKLARMLV
jgi:hypothetical protein